MLIALDIDNVTLDFDSRWRTLYREWFDSEPAPPDDWNAPFQSDMIEDEASFFSWFEKAGGWDNIPWVPGAPWGIDSLLAEGHQIRFVTARTGAGAKAAVDWHRRSPWAGCQLFADVANKATVLADVWVDDSPHVAANVTAAGKRLILLDRPWNQDVVESALVSRVANWHGVLDEVARMASGKPKRAAKKAA